MLFEVTRPGVMKISYKFLVNAESEEEAFNKTDDLYSLGEYKMEDGNDTMDDVTFDDMNVKYKKPDDIGDEYIFGENIN